MFYLATLVFSWAAGAIDYGLVSAGRSPALSFTVEGFKDGGTKIYRGFGYRLVKYHGGALKKRMDVRGLFGPEITYTWHEFWPVLGLLRRDKSDIRVEWMNETAPRK